MRFPRIEYSVASKNYPGFFIIKLGLLHDFRVFSSDANISLSSFRTRYRRRVLNSSNVHTQILCIIIILVLLKNYGPFHGLLLH